MKNKTLKTLNTLKSRRNYAVGGATKEDGNGRIDEIIVEGARRPRGGAVESSGGRKDVQGGIGRGRGGRPRKI